MGRESATQRTCRAIALDRGAYGLKQNPTNGAGVADFVFCYRGLFCAWEFKQVGGGKTKAGRAKLQAHHRDLVEAAGGRVAVIETPDQARAFLDEIDASLGHTLIP